MKFTLKHLFWLVAISAVFCLGLSYAFTIHNEANMQLESAKEQAQQAQQAIREAEANEQLSNQDD